MAIDLILDPMGARRLARRLYVAMMIPVALVIGSSMASGDEVVAEAGTGGDANADATRPSSPAVSVLAQQQAEVNAKLDAILVSLAKDPEVAARIAAAGIVLSTGALPVAASSAAAAVAP